MTEELAQLRSGDDFGDCFDSQPIFDKQSNTKEEKISFTELING
jgi:hypothetical protein